MNRFVSVWLVLACSTFGCGTSRLISAETAGEETSSEGDASSTSSTSEGEPTSESSTGEDSETSSGEETETDTDTDETATAFIPDTPPSPGLPCDPWNQDCPDGEKCVPYASSGGSWDASKCVPILGDQGLGEPCTYGGVVEATDDCDATTMCWNANDEGVGTCHAFCTGTPDTPMCPEDSYCPIAGDGTINVCLPTCDPLAQDCEAEGTACYWNLSGEFTCVFTAQDLGLGEPCGFINDCAAGLVCLTAEVVPGCEGAACCGAFCDLNLGDVQCDGLPGTSCVPFFEDGEAPPDYEHVGVCIAP